VTPRIAITPNSKPINQRPSSPPPPLELLDARVDVLVLEVLAALTVKVVLALDWLPAESVIVRLTTTVPAAVDSSVAVAALVPLVKLAMPAPLVIVHR
jgi:hypothetical protein